MAANPSAPEHYRVDVADEALAVLDVPADAHRLRVFEVACALTVQTDDETGGAWHQLTVLDNGARQWERREPTRNPGEFDGLDMRFRRDVPVGQSLRITAAVRCLGSRCRRIVIEVDEQA
jgi:hypothetical protein